MAGLQRSSETFRRSGSSGMVWEDKHQSASGELGETKRQGKGAPAARLQRNGSSGYRAAHVQPALDPPSPRVAVCGFCSLFGKDKQAPRASGNAKGKRR